MSAAVQPQPSPPPARSRRQEVERKADELEMEQKWMSTARVAHFFDVSEDAVPDLDLERTHPLNRFGKAMRQWCYSRESVEKLDARMAKEARSYSKKLGGE